jgi:hypothetical protein
MRALLLVMAGLAISTPARAGDIGCLWTQLPQASRAGFLEAHLAGGEALVRMADETRLEDLVKNCVGPGPDAEQRKAAVGRAFTAYLAELSAARDLARGPAAMQPFALEVAWAGLPPPDRDALIAQVGDDQMTATVTDALRAAVESSWRAAARTGEPDGPTMLLIASYFLSRAVRVRAESDF